MDMQQLKMPLLIGGGAIAAFVLFKKTGSSSTGQQWPLSLAGAPGIDIAGAPGPGPTGVTVSPTGGGPTQPPASTGVQNSPSGRDHPPVWNPPAGYYNMTKQQQFDAWAQQFPQQSTDSWGGRSIYNKDYQSMIDQAKIAGGANPNTGLGYDPVKAGAALDKFVNSQKGLMAPSDVSVYNELIAQGHTAAELKSWGVVAPTAADQKNAANFSNLAGK